MSKTRLIEIPRGVTGAPGASPPQTPAPGGPSPGNLPPQPPAGPLSPYGAPAPGPYNAPPAPRPFGSPPLPSPYGSPSSAYGAPAPGPYGSPGPYAPPPSPFGSPSGAPAPVAAPRSPVAPASPTSPPLRLGDPGPAPPPRPLLAATAMPAPGPKSAFMRSRAAEGLRLGRASGPHPLMAAMYWSCADVLALTSQLAQGAVPSTATQLRANLSNLFWQMRTKGAAAGIVPEDLTDASYAIISLLDEILVQANWPGRAEWQATPLQLEHFHENTAGENFFRRAEAYAQQPHRAHVLQVYFVCLSLGFQGRYGMGQLAELEAFQRQIATAVMASSIPAEIISPHGIAADAGQTVLQREAPIARLGLAFLAFALVMFGVLLAARTVQLSRTLEPMRIYRSASVELPGKP